MDEIFRFEYELPSPGTPPGRDQTETTRLHTVTSVLTSI